MRDHGASAVEYGLMIAAIAAVIVLIIFGLGGVIRGVFTDTCTPIAVQTQGTNVACDGNGDG